ncbi:hypothetical protein ILYODFUR_037989 [Ilyodon furcidens]|uniref:Uncharacterized protein n=1 Tax=Ilyodon furcidens TaxID=33524 RepID=A0ABV0TFP4_9TELE
MFSFNSWLFGDASNLSSTARCTSTVFNSQSLSTASSIVGCREAGAYLQQSIGRKQGTPWTGHQSIAGQHRQDRQPHTHPFTPKGNLERPIYLTDMFFFLDCGRKPEYPEKTHACKGRTLTPCRKIPRSQTQDLLGARQQCYQLRQRAIKTVQHKTFQSILHATS